jgi:CheY-like chemotaxis protein
MEAIGTLAGGITHDFNNLLLAIQGNTTLMILDTDPGDPHYERLKSIEESVQSGGELTRQLLGFARGGKYEVKPTDLNELIKKQNRIFGRARKEITVRGKYEEDLWTVEVDQAQIEQVLLNLYVNGADAMPDGGALQIQTENVILDETSINRFPFDVKPGKYVNVEVTDTGVGMDEATQDRIFDPFFTTKEIGRGTGLGLASAYGIIKNHGGVIVVESVKGEGTTFHIYLPASDKEVVTEVRPREEVLKGRETILVVDDEDVTTDLVLKTLGYSVSLARSGKDAVKILKEKKDIIDIVILDMIMPGMGGSETYEQLKKVKGDIKVLLSSGYSIEGQATKILEKGCDGFIQKPFKMKELSTKIREILEKR